MSPGRLLLLGGESEDLLMFVREAQERPPHLGRASHPVAKRLSPGRLLVMRGEVLSMLDREAQENRPHLCRGVSSVAKRSSASSEVCSSARDEMQTVLVEAEHLQQGDLAPPNNS